ncbi:Protein of unknown function [Lactobacillus helveticus CIRM-BIA 103]|nr:Protein of unknown function [Lactobacillus helveticus CIRM-BIA 103]
MNNHYPYKNGGV